MVNDGTAADAASSRPAPLARARAAPFVEYALARFAPEDGLVLDVGCGPALYRKASPARYIGVDVDDFRAHGAADGADILAAAGHLPIGDSKIDLAFVKSALHLMPDPDGILREIRRVLKRGGRIIVFDYNRRTLRKLAAKLGADYPLWSQWQLKARVAAAGFARCRLLGAVSREVGVMEGLLRFPAQELLGTWATVTGVKPR